MFVSPNVPTDYPIKTGYYDQFARDTDFQKSDTIPSPPRVFQRNDSLDNAINIVDTNAIMLLLGKLSKQLAAIEKRLGMIESNQALESKWAQLRELGKQYRALEAELLEKEEMWAKISAPERK